MTYAQCVSIANAELSIDFYVENNIIRSNNHTIGNSAKIKIQVLASQLLEFLVFYDLYHKSLQNNQNLKFSADPSYGNSTL